tara:strand:+ start:1241 stop:3019 length:1779 start_codon:yes stop_codon:yes gene_type:complete
MSRRSTFRYIEKNKKKTANKKPQNTLAEQLKQKSPEQFAALQQLAENAKEGTAPQKEKTRHSGGGPKFMPGDFSTNTMPSKKKANKQSAASKKPKKKKKRGFSEEKAAQSPYYKPPAERGKAASHKSTKPIQKSLTLLDYFEKIQRTDSVITNTEMGSLNSLEMMNSWQKAHQEVCRQVNNPESKTLDIVIGFDFGTSSAKIVVNMPYEQEGKKTFAFPVPRELRADDHAHCWKTLLFINDETGSFSLTPEENATPISEIKSSAMQESVSRILYKFRDIQLTARELCTAYIGLILRRVKGWIYAELLDRQFDNGGFPKIYWEMHLGLPAAKKDDKRVGERFEKIAKLAWILSEKDTPISAANYLDWMQPSQGLDSKVVLSIRPEVIAQTVGFINAGQEDFGSYAIVDIGASTIDICTFNVVNSYAGVSQNLFYSSVQLIGSQSPEWIPIVNREYEQNFSSSDLKHYISVAFGKVVITTKRIKLPNETIWRETLPVFLCGGGQFSEIHLTALADFQTKYGKYTLGEIKYRTPKVPKELNSNCQNDDYHRLSVAWGLSIPELDFNKYAMPSDIEDISSKTKVNYEDNYIGPEQT